MLLLPETIANQLEEMKEALTRGDVPEATDRAAQLSTMSVARALTECRAETAHAVLFALPEERVGEVLGRMPPPLAAEILVGSSPEERVHLFRRVRPDFAADIYHALREEEPEVAQELLMSVDEPGRGLIERLGRYPPETAGAVMVLDYVAIESGSTVKDALAAIRSAPDYVERTAYIYVVDGERRPEGVLSLRELLSAPPETPVDRIMTRELVAVLADDDAVEAAHRLRNRGYKLLPVVDAEQRLVGVLTRGDAFELLTEEVAQGFVRSAQGSPDESFFTPPMGAVQRRLPWMVGNVFLNLGAVFVIASFEETIAQVAILAAFLPMITDMGGNVGIQALSVAIRSIALGEVRIRDFWRAVRKEVLVGLVNGAALGTLFAGMAFVLEGNPWLGLVAGVALGVNVLVAGVVGGSLPFIIKRFGKDPAMMTGPFLTTVTDITGVTIYLGLSTLFLTRII